MTRNDCVAIAEALRRAGRRAVVGMSDEAAVSVVTDTLNKAAEDIATAMADDNPRFEREDFLAMVRGEKLPYLGVRIISRRAPRSKADKLLDAFRNAKQRGRA